MGADLSLSDFAVSPPAGRESHLGQAMTPSKYTDFPMGFSTAQLPQNPHPNVEMSATETLELLRHYRYEVAPWVSATLVDEEMGS